MAYKKTLDKLFGFSKNNKNAVYESMKQKHGDSDIDMNHEKGEQYYKD